MCDPSVTLQEVGAERRLPAGGRRLVGEEAWTQRIWHVRCAGHDEEAILVGPLLAIFESPAVEPLGLGIDGDDLAVVFAVSDGHLGVVFAAGGDRHRQIEDVIGEPRGDDPLHGLRGVGEPRQVAPRARSYEAASDRIAPQRASEVDDDHVVGPAIPIDGSPIDEDTLRRWIQNPVDKWPGGSRAIAHRGVQESSAKQERPAEPALTQERTQCEVRRLDEHRTAVSASRVGRRADPVRHPIVPRRRLADEQSIVLNVVDSAERA